MTFYYGPLTYGRVSVGRPTRTLRLLCADTRCSLEDLPGVMGDWERERARERERERVRKIRPVYVTWWLTKNESVRLAYRHLHPDRMLLFSQQFPTPSLSLLYIYIYIYVCMCVCEWEMNYLSLIHNSRCENPLYTYIYARWIEKFIWWCQIYTWWCFYQWDPSTETPMAEVWRP